MPQGVWKAYGEMAGIAVLCAVGAIYTSISAKNLIMLCRDSLIASFLILLAPGFGCAFLFGYNPVHFNQVLLVTDWLLFGNLMGILYIRIDHLDCGEVALYTADLTLWLVYVFVG